MAVNLGSSLVTTAETEAAKVSLVAKRTERTEQIRSNLGDKISMNNQCKGEKRWKVKDDTQISDC